ncbi:hypothetical protein LTR84_012621 [Exophiala bonariae]|uniref:Clr5 domain-containing protein n=1 Tax=Exophiala bonariae TaxID=1690606 RepID=A0AAV9NEZ0_9EURO|nr:hypothetical protein LTR84_012621 [Exophiala bonariae]
MALSLGNTQGWSYGDVTQSQAPAPSAPASHFEAREGPTPAQWQAVREEIRVLYEKKPLKDVKRILERRGFRATERMYKARLATWGFSKNYSDRDYQICAVLHYIRLNSGKQATTFEIHGHKRSLKDLHKYIKGRKMSEEEFLATALKNIHCRSQEEQERDQQYAHVRSFTPEVDVELELAAHSSSPTKPSLGTLGEIAKSSPSPTRTDPVSGAWIGTLGNPRPASTHRGSPTSETSPHERTSPVFWSSFQAATQLTPSTQQSPANQSPSRDNGSIAWGPNLQRQYESSSPFELPYAYSSATANPSLGATDDHLRYAGSLHNIQTPAMSCQHLGRNVEYMALQVVDAPSLKSISGYDDIPAWRLISDTSSPESSDFEQICPHCNDPTNNHFISLTNLELPQQSRSILNPTPNVSKDTIQVPGSSRHDHSWKWVARSFSACIYLNRGNDTLSQRSLADADHEFERMLVPHQDPKVILALNQTLSILHMHDEGEITKAIMRSAFKVAERVLGLENPLTVLVRWMVLVADLEVKKGEISSDAILNSHNHFVRLHGRDDPRSIASLYCYGYMLNVERRLEQAEEVLKEVYELSKSVLGPRHLQSISALTNLSRCAERQGRTDEAIGMLKQALEDARDTLGASHPRRLESMRNLALLYEKQGRLDETEEIYWFVLEGRIKMLGRSHSYTLGMKRDLEILLRKRGKWGAEKPVDEEGQQPEEASPKGKGNVKHQADNMNIDQLETPEQIRLQDLWDWDPNEKWESTESRARRRSEGAAARLLRLNTSPLIDPSPPILDNISSDWDRMDSDVKSLGESDDSGSVHEAF